MIITLLIFVFWVFFFLFFLLCVCVKVCFMFLTLLLFFNFVFVFMIHDCLTLTHNIQEKLKSSLSSEDKDCIRKHLKKPLNENEEALVIENGLRIAIERFYQHIAVTKKKEVSFYKLFDILFLFFEAACHWIGTA